MNPIKKDPNRLIKKVFRGKRLASDLIQTDIMYLTIPPIKAPVPTDNKEMKFI